MSDRFYDNTRVQEFRRCPRKFYFRHVRDWEPTGFAPALVFGSSWHAAMDVVWKAFDDGERDKEAIVTHAYEEFVREWVDQGGTHPTEMYPEEANDILPRHPSVGKEMLYEYVDARWTFFTDPAFKLIDIERAFAVPLDPKDETLFYVGRFDKVFSIGDDIYIGEHKTTSMYSRAATFRPTFIDMFSPNSQVDGYAYAAHMLYGDKVKAVWIDGALVHKKIHDGFKFIPVERKFSQLDAWLWETREWIRQMEGNWSIVNDGLADHAYMPAFPKNTNSCQDYNKNCAYASLCKMFPNPHKQGCPAGFVENHWSPFDQLELDKIGLTRGEGGSM